MSDANVFRQFAEEAMHDSSEATGQDEKQALEELACTWAKAALMSDRLKFAPELPRRQTRR